MWTADQRHRLYLENEVLRCEGFDQFTVYHDRTYDQYWAAGTATASSGHQYRLYIPIPSSYPSQRPPLYVTKPDPLRMFDGNPVSSSWHFARHAHACAARRRAGRRFVTGATHDGTPASCCRRSSLRLCTG